MKALERKIPGTFTPTPTGDGYTRKLGEQVTLFAPNCSVARYDPKTGELYGYAPDYDAIEAAKSPAVRADAPGEYVYCYEMEQAPTNCDFSASRAYYGKHFFLRPLRDDLPRLQGRGITYDQEHRTYMVTNRAYDKLTTQFRIRLETCLD